MGIPIVDLTATYTNASRHPVFTALILLSLIALQVFLYWLSRRFPKHIGKVRLGMLAVLLVLAIPFVWVSFKPHPAPIDQLFEAAQQMQQATETAGQ